MTVPLTQTVHPNYEEEFRQMKDFIVSLQTENQLLKQRLEAVAAQNPLVAVMDRLDRMEARLNAQIGRPEPRPQMEIERRDPVPAQSNENLNPRRKPPQKWSCVENATAVMRTTNTFRKVRVSVMEKDGIRTLVNGSLRPGAAYEIVVVKTVRVDSVTVVGMEAKSNVILHLIRNPIIIGVGVYRDNSDWADAGRLEKEPEVKWGAAKLKMVKENTWKFNGNTTPFKRFLACKVVELKIVNRLGGGQIEVLVGETPDGRKLLESSDFSPEMIAGGWVFGHNLRRRFETIKEGGRVFKVEVVELGPRSEVVVPTLLDSFEEQGLKADDREKKKARDEKRKRRQALKRREKKARDRELRLEHLYGIVPSWKRQNQQPNPRSNNGGPKGPKDQGNKVGGAGNFNGNQQLDTKSKNTRGRNLTTNKLGG